MITQPSIAALSRGTGLLTLEDNTCVTVPILGSTCLAGIDYSQVGKELRSARSLARPTSQLAGDSERMV